MLKWTAIPFNRSKIPCINIFGRTLWYAFQYFCKAISMQSMLANLKSNFFSFASAYIMFLLYHHSHKWALFVISGKSHMGFQSHFSVYPENLQKIILSVTVKWVNLLDNYSIVYIYLKIYIRKCIQLEQERDSCILRVLVITVR